MKTILLSDNNNNLEKEIVSELFDPKEYVISYMNCDECNIPKTPVNCLEQCTKLKLNYMRDKHLSQPYDYYISIGFGIEIDPEDLYDYPVEVCIVLIEHNGLLGCSETDVGLTIPDEYYQKLTVFTQDKRTKIQGYSKTIEEISNKYNWIELHHDVSRYDQLKPQFYKAKSNLSANIKLSHFINEKYKLSIPENLLCVESNNHGIADFFTIFREYNDISKLLDLFVDIYKYDCIDYIIGLEPTGFMGFGLACALGVGFIPIRYKGKIPGSVKSLKYKDETIEIADNIRIGSRILIFDDIISDRLISVHQLMESINCTIIDTVVIRNINEIGEFKHHCTVLLQDI